MIDLLSIKNSNSSIALSNEESSPEEWRQEAYKLELQGKTEQAAEIESNIFMQEPA